MKPLAIFAALAVAGVIVGVIRAVRVYDELELDHAFDDIIANEYTSDPATWPRAVRDPR